MSLFGNLDYHLLRAARKPQEKSDRQRGPSLAVELPRTFEEFLALVERAFGESPEGRSFSSAAEGERAERSVDPRLRGG